MGLLEKLLSSSTLWANLYIQKKSVCFESFLSSRCSWLGSPWRSDGGRGTDTRAATPTTQLGGKSSGGRPWLPSYRLIIPCTEMHSQNSFRQTKSHALVHLFLALVDAGKTNAKIESWQCHTLLSMLSKHCQSTNLYIHINWLVPSWLLCLRVVW